MRYYKINSQQNGRYRMASEITLPNATRVFNQNFLQNQKIFVYNTQPRDIPHLRSRIVEKSERIIAETLQNVREEIEV